MLGNPRWTDAWMDGRMHGAMDRCSPFLCPQPTSSVGTKIHPFQGHYFCVGAHNISYAKCEDLFISITNNDIKVLVKGKATYHFYSIATSNRNLTKNHYSSGYCVQLTDYGQVFIVHTTRSPQSPQITKQNS